MTPKKARTWFKVRAFLMGGACQRSETASLNHTHQDHHDGHHQQDVDQAAQGVRRYEAQQPQQHQEDGKCFKHGGCLFLDFMANDAAYSGASQCACRAAAGQDRTPYGANAGPNGRALFLFRHASARGDGQTGQCKQGGVGALDQCVRVFHGELLMDVDECLVKLCARWGASPLR